MYGKVLEDALDDGLEEEVPDYDKGRRVTALPARMVLDPNSRVQPSLGQSVLRNTPQEEEKMPSN